MKQDDYKNNEPSDIFSRKIRQKLEYHEDPVDENLWENIEKKIHSRSKKVILWPWLLSITLAAAAASISLVAVLSSELFVSDNNATRNKPSTRKTSKTTILKEKSADNNDVKEDQIPFIIDEINNTNADSTKVEKQLPNQHNATTKTDQSAPTSTKNKNNKTPFHEQKIKKTITVQPQPDKQKIEQTTLSDADTKPEKPTDDIQPEETKPVEESHADYTAQLTENKQSILTATPQETARTIENKTEIKNNATLNTNTTNTPEETIIQEEDTIANVAATNKREKQASTHNENHWHIAAPFTFDKLPDFNDFPRMAFGITIRKDISPRFGIQSGLICTHLRTNYNNVQNGTLLKVNDLYYLGIPLNAIIRIWHNRKWDIYGAVGITMQKGIKSISNEYTYTEENTEITKESRNIKALQWSSNISVAVSYKFYRNLGVFLEPACTYYFKSDQPQSTYTQKPFKLKLIGGLIVEL
jgi:hypothetical protein